MPEPQPPMIKLTRPSGLKETTQTLLGGLFADVARLGGAAAGFGQVTERARDLAKRFSAEDTPEDSGWRLVYAGLERAIDEAAAPLRDFPESPERLHVDHLMQFGGESISFDVIEIPLHFLRQPKSLPILSLVGPVLERALHRLGVDAEMAKRRAVLLPRLFVAALADLRVEHSASFEAIQGLTGSELNQAEWQEQFWLYYREKLARDLTRPLFAGRFSLHDLYQRLRGYRRTRDDDGEYVHHVDDLEYVLDSWLEDGDPDDLIRVVTGGPGSGKSSFVKWWAAKVLERGSEWRVLVVPLHRLRTFDLEVEIGRFARNEGFPKNPVSVHEGEPRLVLVLDGLDELDADRTRGQAAAGHLVNDVHHLLDDVSGQIGRVLRVVLAGREVIVSALQNEIADAERQIFYAIGYLDAAEKRRVDERYITSADWEVPKEFRWIDQRVLWWEKWAALRGDAHEGMPATIRDKDQLTDLSDQPLLNHLLALAHSENPDFLIAEAGVNTVYARLLSHVWRRSWGPDVRGARMRAQLPSLRSLSETDFKKVFESIGLAVWQYGGGRSIEFSQVENIAEDEGVREQLSVLQAAAENDVLDLLTAFYFRREGATRTFELTHKSFGEYFAALRLMRLIEELYEPLSENGSNGQKALQHWYRCTFAAKITAEILGFLEGELRLLTLDMVHVRRATLIRLLSHSLKTGIALAGCNDVLTPRGFREAQHFDATAELALVAAIGTCCEVLIEKSGGQEVEHQRSVVRWSPDWPDSNHKQRTSAWDLLRRLEAGTALDPRVRRYMPGIDLDRQVIHTDLENAGWAFVSAKWTNLRGANLSGASLTNADFHGANLSDTNLTNANLSGAILSGANLTDANLSHSSVSHADLGDADLTNANLTNADISGANLNEANLVNADLRGAKLTDANLSGAALKGSNLSAANLGGTNLTSADFSGAELNGCYLSGARVNNANLSGAKLNLAIFRGANLSGANLSSAELSGADLSGSNLSGAGLSDADLLGANLNDADLSEADLFGANLSGADLSGVDLHSTLSLSRIQLMVARKVDWDTVPADLPEE